MTWKWMGRWSAQREPEPYWLMPDAQLTRASLQGDRMTITYEPPPLYFKRQE